MFSVFMDLVVPNILNLKDIENLYIEVQENQYNVKPDVFSYVLDQKLDDTYQTVHCGFKGGWRKPGISLGAIEDWRIPINKKGNYT